jgi:hypothetical protein
LSCASTPVHTDRNRQVNRKNFLNITFYGSVAIGTTLSVCFQVLDTLIKL